MLPQFIKDMQEKRPMTPFTVDYGIEEKDDGVIRPQRDMSKVFDLKKFSQQVQPQEKKWKTMGFNDENEYKIAVGMKDDGFTKEEIRQALNQYKDSIEPLPKNENLQGFDMGVKAGGAISEFGQGLKFEATDNDNLFTSGLKFLGNLPGDTLQLAGDLISVVSNPVGAAQGINEFAGTMVETGLNKAFGQDVYTSEERRALQEAISGELRKISDDPSILRDMAVENPADILFAVTGGLNLATNTAKAQGATGLATKLERAEKMTNPIRIQTEAVKGLGRVGQELFVKPGATATAKLAGLDLQTWGQYFRNPELVKEIGASQTRARTLADKVVSKIDDRITEVGELGREYAKLKRGNIVTNADEIVTIKNNVMSKFDTRELTKKDMSAIKDAEFYLAKYTDDVSDSNLLSLRQQLDSIKYDESGNIRKLSKNGNSIVTELRRNIDDIAKTRIDGLRELDAKFAPEITELNKIRKTIFDRNGDLKDGYIGEISNLLGSNKQIKLERIQKLVPEIADEINAIKALQKVELAQGVMTGNYLQEMGRLGGLSVAVGTTNPMLGIATLLITSPTVVTKALSIAGYSAQTVGSVAEKIKRGIQLTTQEANAVSKAIRSEINEQALKGKEALGGLADDIADKVGARSKFMDDTRTGMSVSDDFKTVGTTKSADIIDTVNPTGGLFVNYTPSKRANGILDKNKLTTLDKTMGVSPDTEITIYRGAPVIQKKIVDGDFVTTNKELAKSYTGEGKVLELKVKAKDILDEINEPLGDEYLYISSQKQNWKNISPEKIQEGSKGIMQAPNSINIEVLRKNSEALKKLKEQGYTGVKNDRGEIIF